MSSISIPGRRRFDSKQFYDAAKSMGRLNEEEPAKRSGYSEIRKKYSSKYLQ